MVHDWFASTTAPAVRVAVTVAAAALVVVGWLLVRAARRRFGDGVVDRTVTLVAFGGYAALAAGAAWAVALVWNVETLAGAVAGSTTGTRVAVRATVSLATLAVAYVLVGISRRVVDDFARRRLSVTTHQGEILFRGVQVTLYAVAIVATLDVWNVSLTNLLVSAGVLGVVVGLAAQQTLGTVIAGFVIMLSRPFEVGDYVRIGDREGVVTEITVVSTRLRTVDREHVAVPNDVVENGEITNYSRYGLLRVHVPLVVDYDADLDRAIAVATEAVESVDLVRDKPGPDYDARFGDDGVELDLRFFVDDPDGERRWHARRDAVVAVKGAFDDAGLSIPYPQRELSGRGTEDGFRVQSEAVGAVDGDE